MNLIQAIGGIVLGAVVAFWLGYLLRARLGRIRLQSTERRAASVAEQATRDADTLKRNAVLEGR